MSGQSSQKLEEETVGGNWTISVAGISETTGFLVQASHTVENSDLKSAMVGLSQITEMFKEKKVVPLAPVLANSVIEVFNAPLEAIKKAIPPPPPEKEEIRTVKVSSMKLMYTENGNPYLIVKASPGLMAHGVNAWQESWEEILGNDKAVFEKFGMAKDIPVPAKMQFAWVAYKGSSPQKVVGFSSNSNEPGVVGK